MNNRQPVAVEIVRSVEELQKAFSVRSVVFIGEQLCPYAEEFDGNDLCATHFMASIDQEVVGTLRVRCFSDFAKLERLAVLAPYRGRGVAAAIVTEALTYIQYKGYMRFQLHAQTRFVRFWERWAHRVATQDVFVFSDHEYLVMTGRLPAVDGHMSMGTNPMVLNRPEGAWHLPSVLEASQVRFQRGQIASNG